MGCTVKTREIYIGISLVSLVAWIASDACLLRGQVLSPNRADRMCPRRRAVQIGSRGRSAFSWRRRIVVVI
jgi:hypothetical protein